MTARTNYRLDGELFWKNESGELPRQPLPVNDPMSLHERGEILTGIDSASKKAFEKFERPIAAEIGRETVEISDAVRAGDIAAQADTAAHPAAS